MSSNIRPVQSVPFPPGEKKKTTLGERLTRNTVIAVLLLLTVIGIRESGSGGFLQAIQAAVENEWDQNVGRLTYVNGTISEAAVQVFGFGSADAELTAPVFSAAVETFQEDSPYLVYHDAGNVYAAASGEVSQIAHDDDAHYIVHIIHEKGLDTVYYGLETCLVSEGDPVTAQTLLGFSKGDLAFEVRRSGTPLNWENRLIRREE